MATKCRSLPTIAVYSNTKHFQQSMMADRNSAYFRGPDAESLQAEYRNLVDGGAAPSNATPKVADSEIDRRIAELDRWMGSRKGSADYRKYWDDPGIQREYAELLERRESAKR